MGWRVAIFKEQRVHVEVDGSGALLERSGRVAIRYGTGEGAKVYRAAISRIALVDGSEIRDLPPGVDADSAPAKSESSRASRGSGFGRAGTRSAAQAAAAASHARSRIDALPEGTTVVFTDGACRGNPGPAGSGVVVQLPDGRRIEASRALGQGTNNIAELTAIAVALDLLDAAGIAPAAPVALFSDSSYADGVLTRGWKAKANVELIREIKARLRSRPGVTIHWVAGHAGVEGNERADQLANRGIAGVTQTTGLA